MFAGELLHLVRHEVLLEAEGVRPAGDALSADVAGRVEHLVVGADDLAALLEVDVLVLLHLALEEAPVGALLALEGRRVAVLADHVAALRAVAGELLGIQRKRS